MSENDIYYYEVFLRSTLNNKQYKISLGSLSGSKFKTIDTEFPTSSFLSSVVGGTNNIQNNIDLILDYNKNTYNLSASTLKDFRTILASESYNFNAERINLSDDAVGDPNNNNEPYVLVKNNNNIVVQLQNLVNEDLTNIDNREYYAKFVVTIADFDNRIQKINITIRSSNNPLPQPPDPTSNITTISNYLYNFFAEEETNSLFQDAIRIMSIQWLNNFWKLSENTNTSLSIGSNEFTALQDQAPVYEYNKKIKLSGEARDDSKCKYSIERVGIKTPKEFIDAISDELNVYISKYSTTEKDENGDDVIVFNGKLKQFLNPKPGSKNWKVNLFPEPPAGTIDIKYIDTDNHSLPQFRFFIQKEFQTDLPEEYAPPEEIYMNSTVKFQIKSTVYFIIYSVHYSMSGTLKSDAFISEPIDIKKWKFDRYDKPAPPGSDRLDQDPIYRREEDFYKSEAIVKEHQGIKKIHSIEPQPYNDMAMSMYQGTELPSGTRKISLSLPTIARARDPIKIKLVPKTRTLPNGSVIPDVRQVLINGKYYYSIEYKADARDLKTTVSDEITSIIRTNLEDLLEPVYPEVSLADDEAFFRNIIEGFRGLLFDKANEKANDITLVKRECLYFDYNDGNIKYMLWIPPNEVGKNKEDLEPGEIDLTTPNINNTRISVVGNDDAFND